MPRGRGIYRDEPRDKLQQSVDAVKATEEDNGSDGETTPTAERESSDSPRPVEPPD